jgi:tetratricopeptide (TPR) repeat protein
MNAPEVSQAEQYLNSGHQYLGFGHYSIALSFFEQAIALNPELPEAWEGKASTLRQLGRYEEAITASEKAIILRTNVFEDNAQYRFKQGGFQFNAGDFEGAMINFDKVIRINPNNYEAWFIRGVALEKLGNYEESITSYKKALKLNPSYHQAWQGYGNVLCFVMRYEEAITCFDKAIEFKSDDDQAWSNRGAALANLGLNKEAIESFDEAIKLNPKDQSAWHNRGFALFNLENFENAIESFDMAVEIQPDFHEAWSNRGDALAAIGHYEEAIASFDAAVKFNPENHDVWSNRGNALADLERYEEAIDSFDKSVEIHPDHPPAWNGRGIALMKLGNFENAIASFDKAIKGFNEAIQYKSDLYGVWQNRGDALADLERYEEAIDSFDNVIKLKPNYHEAWTHRGTALANLERYEEAIDNYNNAIKHKPDDEIAWNNRGSVYFALENYKEAINSFNKALNFHPEYYESWSNLGDALLKSGQFEEAIVNFDKAINLKPDDELTWNNRGVALLESEQFDDAISSFNKVIQLQPDNYGAWSNRGEALARLEHYGDAIVSFNEAIKLQPDYYKAWLNRGLTLAKLENFKDAILNYEHGLTHVLKETQPEGWGELHHFKGMIYSVQAKLVNNIQTARSKYFLALKCYEKALQTLEIFPKAYLNLIQSLIKTHLGLANSETANQWRVRGLEIFRQLINAQPTSEQKCRIEAEFSGFSQVAVDALASDKNFAIALEAAERYKNRCLTWILDEWQEQVVSPSYAEMRRLLNSNREIIYWHLSEETLTTFILTSNQENPTVLTQKSIHLETWRKDWDKCYGDYRSKGKDQAQHQAHHPWRDTLKTELDRLKAILDIEKIEAHLSPHTHLILIPHRDLHRFPIHALFGDDRITTYLPSIKVGLAQKPPSTPSTRFLLNVEDPARPDQPPLQFARLESAIIQAMFAHNVKAIDSDNGNRATVETALQENRGIFHFTGHGDYNARQPEYSAIGLADTDRLTAKEISALNLQQYELACLSACETALTGMQTIHTEYVGLTSAFLQSGVSQVVSTLWTVPEVSNAYIMIQFYQFLQNGMSPAEALKRAQTWLRTVTNLELADWLIETSQLKNLDPLINQELEQQAFSLREEANASTIDLHHPPYADPYHWAAFTLTGRGFL